MLTFHFEPLKYWRVDMRSHILAAHRLQITSGKYEIILKKKLLRMLFKVILNEDKWKVGVEMSGLKIIKRELKCEPWRWVCNRVRWNGNIINENSLHLILIKEANARTRVSEWVKMWTMIWIWCGWIFCHVPELHYNMNIQRRICWNESIFLPLPWISEPTPKWEREKKKASKRRRTRS